MKGTFRIAIIAGIDVRIHWSLLLFSAFLCLVPFPDTSVEIGIRAGYVVILFVSVLLHEFGHSFTGRFCDGASDVIVLWPLGGLAFVHLPDAPMAHFLTALAGPVVSAGLWVLAHWLQPMTTGWVATSLDMVAQLNWMMWMFNLLPAFPLDGGRMLQAVMWRQMGFARSMWVAVHVSLVIGGGLLVWSFTGKSGGLDTMMGSAVACFVIFNAWQQRQLLQYQAVNEEFWSSRPGVPHNHPYRNDPAAEDADDSTWKRLKRKMGSETEPLDKDEFLREQVDPILDKISREGMQSLTKRERKILESAKDLMQKPRR